MPPTPARHSFHPEVVPGHVQRSLTGAFIPAEASYRLPDRPRPRPRTCCGYMVHSASVERRSTVLSSLLLGPGRNTKGPSQICALSNVSAWGLAQVGLTSDEVSVRLNDESPGESAGDACEVIKTDGTATAVVLPCAYLCHLTHKFITGLPAFRSERARKQCSSAPVPQCPDEAGGRGSKGVHPPSYPTHPPPPAVPPPSLSPFVRQHCSLQA